MSIEHYKQYSLQAKQCIKGESFFESIISEFAIPHHIVGQKDIGVDYICEWVFGNKPSGVLFSVQIKSFSHKTAEPHFHENDDLNKLESYRISNSNFKITLKTLHYWKGLGMPAYLFAICTDLTDNEIGCFYKRYTPVLTQDKISVNGFDYYEKFYKANQGSKFLAFAVSDKNTHGFARDLFIDYIRWNYFKGSIAYLNPRNLGLEQFPDDNIFPELVREYEAKIHLTYSKWKQYLESVNISSFKPYCDRNFTTLATSSDIPINKKQ